AHAEQFGMLVHHVGKGFLAAGNVLGQCDAGVVARLDDDAAQDVFQAHARAFLGEHLRAFGLPGLDADEHLVIEMDGAVLQIVVSHVDGHDLGETGWRQCLVGVLLDEDRAGRGIDHNVTGGIDLGRARNDLLRGQLRRQRQQTQQRGTLPKQPVAVPGNLPGACVSRVLAVSHGRPLDIRVFTASRCRLANLPRRHQMRTRNGLPNCARTSASTRGCTSSRSDRGPIRTLCSTAPESPASLAIITGSGVSAETRATSARAESRLAKAPTCRYSRPTFSSIRRLSTANCSTEFTGYVVATVAAGRPCSGTTASTRTRAVPLSA